MRTRAIPFWHGGSAAEPLLVATSASDRYELNASVAVARARSGPTGFAHICGNGAHIRCLTRIDALKAVISLHFTDDWVLSIFCHPIILYMFVCASNWVWHHFHTPYIINWRINSPQQWRCLCAAEVSPETMRLATRSFSVNCRVVMVFMGMVCALSSWWSILTIRTYERTDH